MKKLLRLFAIAAIAISLVACKQPNTEQPAATTDTTSTTTTPTTPADNGGGSGSGSGSGSSSSSSGNVQPVTDTANLAGSNWFISKTYTTESELEAFNLANCATSFTGTYMYYFESDGNGCFDSWCDIVFKNEIDEDTRDNIKNQVRAYFPYANFTWTANGNTINFSVESQDPDNPTELTGVLENSVLKITYPADIAQALNIGTTATTLNCTQCSALCYSDLILNYEITSEESFIESCPDMFGTSLTKGTDYTINGLNFIITDAGISKIFATIKALFIANGRITNEATATVYFLFYDGSWGFYITNEYLTSNNFVSGTDYTITHNNTVVELTEAGFIKYRKSLQ